MSKASIDHGKMKFKDGHIHACWHKRFLKKKTENLKMLSKETVQHSQSSQKRET